MRAAMIETMPLERAPLAYAHMMNGVARFPDGDHDRPIVRSHHALRVSGEALQLFRYHPFVGGVCFAVGVTSPSKSWAIN